MASGRIRQTWSDAHACGNRVLLALQPPSSLLLRQRLVSVRSELRVDHHESHSFSPAAPSMPEVRQRRLWNSATQVSWNTKSTTLRSGSSLRFDRRNRLLARKEPPIEVALCFFRVPVGCSRMRSRKLTPRCLSFLAERFTDSHFFAPTEVAWLHGLHVGVAGVAVSVQATPSTRSSDPEGRWRGSLFTRKTNRVPTTSKKVIPADFLSMQRLPELRQGSVRKPSRWPDAGVQLLRSPRPGLTAGRMLPRQIPHSTTTRKSCAARRPALSNVPPCAPVRAARPTSACIALWSSSGSPAAIRLAAPSKPSSRATALATSILTPISATCFPDCRPW